MTHDIVAKLWNLCNVLKDDGVTYHQYVTELTYILFLKMAEETGTEDQIPEEYRWADLLAKSAPDRLEFYKITLIHLGTHGSTLVKEIFANASSFIKKPATLSTLVSDIGKLDWYSARQEGLGDLYEGLLEKNANEKKSGAGQYFTPRQLIDSMVTVMQPTLDDVIQDPAAGTGGFLIAANHYLREHRDFDSLTEAQQKKWHHPATGYAHPHQSALRHQERRRPAQSHRFYLPHQQQAVLLRPAHLPRPPARRTRRRRPAGQCPLRVRRRQRHPPRPHGQVQPPHHPPPPHRHLLRPGREDQRPLLHPRPDRQRQHQGSLGL